MRKFNVLLSLLLVFSITACAAKNDSAEELVHVAKEDPSPIESVDNYDEISNVFCEIIPNSSVSVTNSGSRLDVVISDTGLSSDSQPERWVETLSILLSSTEAAKDIASTYDVKNIASQIIDENGDILATCFSGKIQYDAYSHKAEYQEVKTSFILGPGTYKVGTDIPAGKYDCFANSGLGVFRGEVASLGSVGFAQTMGESSISIGDTYASVVCASSYSNLTLADGDTIYIEMSLNVEFVPK